MILNGLSTLDEAQSRSISPENFSGEKGKGGMAVKGTGAYCARDLGQGGMVSPSIKIEPGQTFELADIEGPGIIDQIWMETRIFPRSAAQARKITSSVAFWYQTLPGREFPQLPDKDTLEII